MSLATWAVYQVEGITSVEEFLSRYYKAERYTGRGADYAALLLASYNREMSERGYCFISSHDSVTGRTVSILQSQLSA